MHFCTDAFHLLISTELEEDIQSCTGQFLTIWGQWTKKLKNYLPDNHPKKHISLTQSNVNMIWQDATWWNDWLSFNAEGVLVYQGCLKTKTKL